MFLFRLVVVSQARDLDIAALFKYELSHVPFSLCHVDGTLRKPTKCTLMHALEKKADSSASPIYRGNAAFIIDGMGLIQMVRSGGQQAFGQLADHLLSVIMPNFEKMPQCRRIDIVFDR